MALDFPGTPATGTTYTGPGGVIWVYDGTKWVSGTLTTGIYAPITNDVGRNLIHNSQFNIQQRGVGPFSPSLGYTADRWITQHTWDTVSVTIAALTNGDRTAIGDEAATNCLVTNFTGLVTPPSSITCAIHRIEDVRRLATKTLVLSFWAVADRTLKLGLNLSQSPGSGGGSGFGQSSSTAVTLSTTWARYSAVFTMPSVSTFTMGSGNDHHTALNFYYSCDPGSGVQSGNIGVQTGIVKLWGVQLEIGTVATPLEKRDPVYELQQCQRFYCTGTVLLTGYATAGTNVGQTITLPVWMRATPAWAQSSNSDVNVSSPSSVATSPQNVWVNGSATATGTFTINRNWTATADL